MLLHAARFTTGYVRLVGQELAPSKCVLLSTSRVVRNNMKDWVLSQEGDKWSVKFDVRDLGGHLDTIFRGWSATLAARVRLVLVRLVLIFTLPWDFHGRVRVVRSMFLPVALKLRSAVRKVVWSRRQPLANVGAVLSMLDGPSGCDPLFLRCLVSVSSFSSVSCTGGPPGLIVLIVFWIWLMRVVVVMGLFIFLFQVPLRLVSGGILIPLLGIGLDCFYLAIWLVLFSIFVLLFLMPGRTRLQLIFVAVRVFGVAPCWIFVVLCSFLTYSSRLASDWDLPDGFHAGEVSAYVPDSPSVWSDGSMVLDSGIAAAGAGMFAHQSELCWSDRR